MVILTAGLGISLLLAFLNMNQLRSSARLAVAVSQLQESESRFRHFFEKNKSVMFLVDPESGVIIDANQAAASYYGYPKPSLLGMLISEINTLPPEEVAQERQRALHEERNYFHFPHRWLPARFAMSKSIRHRSKQLARRCSFSVIHDITERKQQERALREASLQLAVAQSAAQAGFWNWDIVSGKLTWTPELFQLLGLDPATTEGQF
jgi:PAS domain S-box-containing protein